MAGRKLLDAARLLQATSSVVKQHVALGSRQLDVYTKTSGLFGAVKEQTDKLTITFEAGAALARRLAEDQLQPTGTAPDGRSDQSQDGKPQSDFAGASTNKSVHDRSEQGQQLGSYDGSRHDQLISSNPKVTPSPTSGTGQPVDVDAIQAGKVSRLPHESVPEVKQLPAQFKKEPTVDISEPGASVSTEQTSEPSDIFQMRESRVPSSRIGRLWQYGGLGVSMAFGAVGETFRRAAGGGWDGTPLLLTPANLDKLVARLSRMRGAALKLGQMISFQDAKLFPAPIQQVLQRVQDSADYMPATQRDQVLAQNLGSDWRELFSNFNEMPVAAASIGQVHKAIFRPTGQHVAVKIQYPGVAASIDSDLSNLSLLLTASKLLPKGLFLDKTIANARTELAWECDYLREAECATRFRSLLADDGDAFTVPAIIKEASGKQVLTAEYMNGKAVTKLSNLSQIDRDWIGTNILRLCLREICEFRFMQTDPNWTNFLFNPALHKIELLDFGASRDYPAEFIDPYVGILEAASRNDRDTIHRLSVQLGYLTAKENSAMANAHIDSVIILSEPFSQKAPETYDFQDQTITDRVRGLIPVMLRHRLAPPPEETYSLHRKLSGAFLLCARLGSRVPCRELFDGAIRTYSLTR